MKGMTRQQVIDILVQDELDALEDDDDALDSLVREGHPGYNNYSDEELKKEYEEFYEEEIQIVYHTRGDKL